MREVTGDGGCLHWISYCPERVPALEAVPVRRGGPRTCFSRNPLPAMHAIKPLTLEDRVPTMLRSHRSTSRLAPKRQAVRQARHDLMLLKAMAKRLSEDCDAIVADTSVHQDDAAGPRAQGRNALHLQARADAVAALIRETERVLNRLDARPS